MTRKHYAQQPVLFEEAKKVKRGHITPKVEIRAHQSEDKSDNGTNAFLAGPSECCTCAYLEPLLMALLQLSSHLPIQPPFQSTIDDKMMRSSHHEEHPFSEDSRSSTDVEEGLISEKRPEDWHTANPRPQRRFPSTHWLFDAFLLLTITGLLIERFKYPPRPLSITSDITGFSSTFTSRIVSFVPDLSFVPSNTSTFWDASVREKWLSIVPRGLGYVKVEHPEDYTDLPTPIHDYPNETVYTTAMPHQLHCLYNILEVYSAITSENPHKVPTELTFHLRHCFEYVRSLFTVRCGSADSNL